MKKLFTLLGLLALTSSFAQDIYLLDDYLKNIPPPGGNVVQDSTTNQEKSVIEKLLFDVQTAYTLRNNQISKYGNDNAAVIIADAASLSSLTDVPANNKQQVKAIIIQVKNIADLDRQLNAAQLQNMPELKYVFFNCAIVTTGNELKKMLSGTYSNIVFLYSVNVPI